MYKNLTFFINILFILKFRHRKYIKLFFKNHDTDLLYIVEYDKRIRYLGSGLIPGKCQKDLI